MKKFYFSILVFVAVAALSSCGKDTDPVYEGVVINGVTWSEFNVAAPGTFAATPQASGMLYQWNNKIGWSAADPMTDSNGGTTWDSEAVVGDSWAADNDPCPAGWRVPTEDEQATLLDDAKVIKEWTTLGSVNGYKFTDKTSDKSVFFPAAGFRWYGDGALGNVGNDGAYWSGSGASYDYVRYLDFYSGDAEQRGYYMTYGLAVRCVLPK